MMGHICGRCDEFYPDGVTHLCEKDPRIADLTRQLGEARAEARQATESLDAANVRTARLEQSESSLLEERDALSAKLAEAEEAVRKVLQPGMNAWVAEDGVVKLCGVIAVVLNEDAHPDEIHEGERFVCTIRNADGDEFDLPEKCLYATEGAASAAVARARGGEG